MPSIPEYPTMTISFRFLAAGCLALAASVHSSLACPGDVDDDQRVNVNDLLEVIGGWGACPPSPTACPADIDASGAVGVDDLLVVLSGWGDCPDAGDAPQRIVAYYIEWGIYGRDYQPMDIPAVDISTSSLAKLVVFG